MIRARHTSSALRAVASWLMTLAALAGPLGVTGSIAAACGVTCPCDRSADADDQPGHPWRFVDEDARDHARHPDDACDDDAPHEDECPDDCPRCGCSARVVLGMIHTWAPDAPLAMIWSEALTPPDSPSLGARSGVFRPPRALT